MYEADSCTELWQKINGNKLTLESPDIKVTPAKLTRNLADFTVSDSGLLFSQGQLISPRNVHPWL